MDPLQILGDLRDRYARMLALHAAPALPGQLRALARLHPGALRELDRTAIETLRMRAAAVERGQLQPWMHMLALYTDTLRCELLARREAGAAAPAVRGRKLTELALERTAESLRVDVGLVRELVLADARFGTARLAGPRGTPT